MVAGVDSAPPEEKFGVLICLIHLEAVLDKGRPLTLGLEKNERDTLNATMDQARAKIVEIMKQLGKDEVEKMLAREADQMKTNFIGTLSP